MRVGLMSTTLPGTRERGSREPPACGRRGQACRAVDSGVGRDLSFGIRTSPAADMMKEYESLTNERITQPS